MRTIHPTFPPVGVAAGVHPLLRTLSPVVLLLAACNEAPGVPSIAIVPAEPGTLDDLEVVIQGESADPNGDDVAYTYAWFVDGSPSGETGSTIPASATTRDEVWKVVVTPSDGKLDGTTGEAEVTIRNTAPVATLALDPLVPTSGEEVVVTATTEDADVDAVTMTWSWTRDGGAAGLTDATIPADTTRRGETWAVTATPADGTDDGAPVSLSFTVENAPPVLAAVTITPTEPTAPDTLRARFTGAEDPDGDTITVAVSWYVDGVEVATDEVDADGETTLAGLFAKGQEFSVVATPFDGYDEGEPVTSDTVTVLDAAPSASGAHISPDPVQADSVVTCVGDGWSDADGDAESWQTRWTVNGTDVSTDSVLPAGTYARGDVIGCVLVPDDGERTGPEVSAADVTVGNAPPACATASVTIGPDPATTADTLSIVTDGYSACVDADGDELVQVFDWQADGTSVGSASTLAGSVAARGQVIELVTGWSDGFVVGAEVTSNPVPLVNAPPSIDTLALSPSTVVTDTLLAATVSASDSDGDTITLTYAWTVDGVAAGTDATLDGATAFSRGQTITLTVTPSDGYDVGGSATVSAAVTNAVPTAPVVRLSSSAPTEDEAIVCSVQTVASDADGDALAYTFAWTVGGIAYSGASTTTFPGDTIPAATTALGQTWVCTVTASDGTDVGAPGTATAIVGCDEDGDGYTDAACGGDDCDDADPDISPGADELCDSADVDEDCDGLADEADPSLTGSTWYRDADGDAFGDLASATASCSRPAGHVSNPDDCDDTNPTVKPGAYELCDNADADEDCDGYADDADSSAVGQRTWRLDTDGDGYGGATSAYLCNSPDGYVSAGGDCDDADGAVSPAATEVCANGIDDNCDGASFPCGLEGEGSAPADAYVSITGTEEHFAYRVTTGDFNGDGAGDIVTSAYGVETAYVFYGPFGGGELTTSDADVTWTGTNDNFGTHIGNLGDVDSDGDDDLFLGDSATSSGAYLLEGGTFVSDTLGTADAWRTTTYEVNAAGVGDFDGDGVEDFAYAQMGTHSHYATDTLTLYLGDPAGPVSAASWTNDAGSFGADILGDQDLDGDGLEDFIATFTGHSYQDAGVFALLGDSAPSGRALTSSDAWVTQEDTGTDSSNYAFACLPGDVNEDGYPDLGFWPLDSDSTTYYASYVMYLFLGPPTTGQTVADAYASVDYGHRCAGGDTDGDGSDEMFVLRRDYYLSRYLLPISSGALTADDSVSFLAESAALPPLSDLSGDGLDDVVFSAGSIFFFTGGAP